MKLRGDWDEKLSHSADKETTYIGSLVCSYSDPGILEKPEKLKSLFSRNKKLQALDWSKK